MKSYMQTAPYYIALDVGTNSVGWAATDKEYNLLRFKGNSMWGVRLFDEGQTAEERRISRTTRRRLNRRKQRLNTLYLLFKEELDKIDPDFDKRMKESYLINADKTTGTRFSLFADPDYTDKDFAREYKTMYHLRQELVKSEKPHDVRCVYLGVHHILKSRGHFLFEVGENAEENRSFAEVFDEYLIAIRDNLGVDCSVSDVSEVHNIVSDKTMKQAEKIKGIVSLISVALDELTEEKELKKQIEAFAKLIVGANVDLKNMFGDDTLKGSFKVTADVEGDDKFKDLSDKQLSVIAAAKSVYDQIKLEEIMGSSNYISDYMVSKYEEHRKDIKALKEFLKSKGRIDLYKRIFSERTKGLNNYAAYVGYEGQESNCTAENLKDFLKKELQEYKSEIPAIYDKITEGKFAPKLRTTDNGAIPSSLHKKELVKILENASAYLPFLNSKDADGLSVKDKIISLFDFKIPYYVGPLNNSSDKYWIVRSNEKITPWNFDRVVNCEETAKEFILRMTGKCTYTGDDALPLDSLLYREYTVLNEINVIKINGKPISKRIKDIIYNDLFVKSSKKVTKKAIHTHLVNLGEITKDDEITGVADTLTTSLQSYHKLRRTIEKGYSSELIEELIKSIVLFAQDKKLLKKWIKEKMPDASDEDIKYLSSLKFSGWGSLSKTLLCDIMGNLNTETGEVMSVIDVMRENSENLNQVLYNYGFEKAAKEYRENKYGSQDKISDILDSMYISPKVRRSIRQAMKIVDEIIGIKKAAPEKIFIEMARDVDGTNKKEQTKSRKEQLIELYKACEEDSAKLLEVCGEEGIERFKELYNNLENIEDSKLRQDKLYLYYTQFGRCMYSDEFIPLDELQDKNKWDIDHIFPRSRIKDDSLSNRVLVKAQLNRSKTNEYPINQDIRDKMRDKWLVLKNKKMINDTKYSRLVRSEPLTTDELSAFINRQIVETQQSTKALATILGKRCPDSKIVYSKAGNVSDFRKYYAYRSEEPYTEFIKCRDLNDLHHAKDAYLNIVVGNLYDTKFTAEFFKNIHNEEYSLNTEAMLSWPVKGAWIPESKDKTQGTILTVRKTMGKNNILYTRMPREEHGKLFNLTILKKEKDSNSGMPVKKDRSIENYGKYDKIKGAYFALVEHTEKKKRVRSLEPIFICDKTEYEKDNTAFFESKGFKDPRVIVPKIHMDSVLELNGVRYNIKGRSDDNIIYGHMCQLVLDSRAVTVIRNTTKYLQRMSKQKDKKEPTRYDGITAEDNIYLMGCLIDKIDKVKDYNKSIKCSRIILEAEKKNFENGSYTLYEQCVSISKALIGFRCNQRVSGYNGSTIRINKKVSSLSSAYLVNQSPTGLYEYKIDLLKD